MKKRDFRPCSSDEVFSATKKVVQQVDQTIDEVLAQQKKTLSDDGGGSEAKPVLAKAFSVTPSEVIRGREETLTIRCPTLEAPISEVWIDGQRMEVVFGGVDKVVVSGVIENPLTQRRIEVLAEGGRKYYASGKVDIVAIDLDRFLPHPAGQNIHFSDDCSTANRLQGSANGIAFVSLSRPFFEIEIGECCPKGQTRAPAFGFMTQEEDFSQSFKLPSTAHDLKQSVVVGGDLPFMTIDGVKQSTKIAWRPRMELKKGDRLQMLLTHNEFKIFHNREERVSVPIGLRRYDKFFGVVDVAGCLRSATVVGNPDSVFSFGSSDEEYFERSSSLADPH